MTAPAGRWELTALRRRSALLFLTLTPSLAAAVVMYGVLPAREGRVLNGIITLLFAVLFGWIAVGFWSAVAGLFLTLRRFDRFAVTAAVPDGAVIPESVRTALLFPVYNEDARRVTEGVRTVWRSLRALGVENRFDIFILSDSTSPEAWINEEEAWHALCREEGAFSHIFYRHRRVNRKGKSGNIADFCRRWGGRYPYMVCFDADSLMAGETLVRLVLAMEARPDIGIIQTAPKSINSRSLIARVQQFSNHLYGPVFAAGLHYWQLGDAQYWGHNAIIRVEPFMRHCHLPVLPGPKPLGGHILSHDFVEAALMRRAGYGVWLAYELGGSYEENPPSLIDELVRDRRWCQGNLQHSRLVMARGFFPTHRALFINGIMSYVSALLWFFFLVVSTVQVVVALFTLPVYFPETPTLFPDWPRYFTERMLALFGGTAALLFLPKLFTVILTMVRGAGPFGGTLRLAASAGGELILSTLLAPVRMIYHSLFVVTTLLGFTVRWNTQNRDARSTTWLQALRFHWWGVVIGLVWGAFIFLVNRGFFLWLSPIVVGLMISVPLSVWTSRIRVGDWAGRLGLFLTPVDTCPDAVILALNDAASQPPAHSPFRVPPGDGFTRAVVIPRVFALHLSLARQKRTPDAGQREAMEGLIAKALASGPDGLTPAEKNLLLQDPDGLTELHRRVWTLDRPEAARWGIVA
ncbi:MAG: glucans biosynthesis glucosyltransferase MdoH [Planctomycetes bacterium]|nr:glucans biosynthesis glucosyltransferase MdoH [Planctomycetota bacterium]